MIDIEAQAVRLGDFLRKAAADEFFQLLADAGV